MKKILIYGYGNPGRQDDGLGVTLVEQLQQWSHTQRRSAVAFDSNYQLNIEDALSISEYDLVIFVDASIEEIDQVKLTRVIASRKTEFTMHAMTPGFVLHLCQSLYGKYPEIFLLHLKGYSFDFQAPLTKKAERNLTKGIDLIKKIITGSKNPLEAIEKEYSFSVKSK